jgi:hypothetical protein
MEVQKGLAIGAVYTHLYDDFPCNEEYDSLLIFRLANRMDGFRGGVCYAFTILAF